MTQISATHLQLGMQAPAFSLINTRSDTMLSLDDVKTDRATVVMFLCNHCPYVKHVNHELVRLAKEYQTQGVGFVAISSNDVESYPEDGPGEMKQVAQQLGYPFPYLYDPTQEVAKAYGAACTPDTFVFDGDLNLVYRGQIDSSRPRNDTPVTGEDLRAALDAVLAGEPVDSEQRPSVGCSIKWKPGNEPG